MVYRMRKHLKAQVSPSENINTIAPPKRKRNGSKRLQIENRVNLSP